MRRYTRYFFRLARRDVTVLVVNGVTVSLLFAIGIHFKRRETNPMIQ